LRRQTEAQEHVAKPKPIADILRELWELLTAYAKQETVDPLRSLGRYLGYGLGGAALLAMGVFFLALSGLRALQTETGDVFTGAWSAAPYVIVALVLVAIAALAASRITRGPHASRARTESSTP
jgi:hypothetical protein